MSAKISAWKIIEWLIVSLLLVGLWPMCGDTQEGQLTAFHGGRYRSHLLLANGLLAGVGSRTCALGGTCSGLQYGAEDLYWNPARLGFMDRSQMMLDITPPILSLDAETFADLNGEAARAVDEMVAEMGAEELTLSSDDYPNIQATVNQKGLMPNGALATPLNGWGVGLGFYQPLNLELDVIGAQLQACFSDEFEGQGEYAGEEATLSTSADLSLAMDIQVSAISLGLARQLIPRWSIGLAIDRYYGRSSANGRLQAEGLLVAAGDEAAFNDPSASWSNQLHSEMVGSYRGATWGLKVGTSCRLRPNLSLDGILTLPMTLRLNGAMNIVQYTMPQGVDLNSDQPLDADELDLEEPTRTELEDNPTSDEIALKAPGSLKLSAAWRLRFVTLMFQYGHYFGDLSCSYPIADADAPVSYYLSMEPGDSFTLGLDLRVVRLSGGFLLARSSYQRDPEKEGQEPEETRVVVPTFSLGSGLVLGDRYGIDVLLLSIPSAAMRVTSSCYF